MRSLHYFIVKPKNESRYNAVKEINNAKLIINSFEDDVSITNREGIVISTPLNYKGDIEPGDTLLVHHNIFRHHNDVRGKRVNDKSYFRDNEFFIDVDQFFLYKKNETWHTHDRYCFIKPILIEDTDIKDGSKNQPLKGEMMYPNEKLIKQGINKGDIVGHIPHVEYEFHIDGVLMYRMFDHHISIKY